MKILKLSFLGLYLSLFINVIVLAHNEQVFEFPKENYRYQNKIDKSYQNYRAKSLFQTGNIVLTFDDGPHPIYTPLILDILKKWNQNPKRSFDATATFFVVGSMLKNPEAKILIKRIHDEGHKIGLHTLHHFNSNNLSESEFKFEVHETFSLVQSIFNELEIDQNEIYFRFPGGNFGNLNETQTKNLNYHHFNSLLDLSRKLFQNQNCINFVFWTIDTYDWSGNSAQEILGNLKFNFLDPHSQIIKTNTSTLQQIILPASKYEQTEGGVVLMHDVNPESVVALPLILDYMKSIGGSVVQINSLPEYSFQNKSCGYRHN